jgi:hypothetical protein
VAAAHCPRCPWKALEVGEVEEGRDHCRRGGGGPPPAPLGAVRAERPGVRGVATYSRGRRRGATCH